MRAYWQVNETSYGKGTMDIDIGAVYHYLFETYQGIGILVGIGLVLGLIACVIMERRTRKLFKDHEQSEDDWSFFDSETDETDEIVESK